MLTVGWLHRTTSFQHVGWLKHNIQQQHSVSIRSSSTNGLFCLCCHKAQDKQMWSEQASTPLSWLARWRVMGRAPYMIGCQEKSDSDITSDSLKRYVDTGSKVTWQKREQEREGWERRASNGRTRKFILVCGGRQIPFVFTPALWNDPITSHVLDEMFLTSHMAAAAQFKFSLSTLSCVNIYQLPPPHTGPGTHCEYNI